MGTSVLLTTEGTFPFHGGGVSSWCDVLTRHLADIDFSLLAVTMHPYVTPCYTLAPNVRQVLTVPLWGTEQPEEYAWHLPFPAFLERRWATTDDLVAKRFVRLLGGFLAGLLGPDRDAVMLADNILAMHRYFQRYDYDRTMKAPAVWRCFQQFVRTARPAWPHGVDPSVADLSEALRLLARLMSVLYYPVPRTDLGHSTAAAFCGLPCVIAKLEHGTPYLLTEHGIYLREQYLNLRQRIRSPFVRWFLYRLIQAVVSVNYQYADQVSPVCAYNTRWERWWGVPAERLKIIFNGVDPERYCPGKRTQRNRPLVVCMGLIYPLKGQLDLIEAVALARAEIPDIECRLYGAVADPRYYAECQACVRAHRLEEHVAFVGSTSEPWRVYREADILVCPSISEGLPYVLIEAMFTELAIVASDVGGVAETIGEAGVLIRPRRPDELARAIVRLVRDPELREQLGKRARTRALGLFTQDRFLREYREAYECLCDRSSDEEPRVSPAARVAAEARSVQYAPAYQ
jgi:glycosyltransferase involved in cell wall biosynthesis